jgi:hypothetical protein
MNLYVIAASDQGPVKLGISNDPERRVRQLQTGHAAPLYLFHSEPIEQAFLERRLHKDLAHVRTRGEWFDVSVSDAISYLRFSLIEHEPSALIP